MNILALSAGTWIPLAVAAIGLVGSAFGIVSKLLSEERAAGRQAHDETVKLHARIMDQAIPALEHNAAATEAMIRATTALSERLAVIADRENRRYEHRQDGP